MKTKKRRNKTRKKTGVIILLAVLLALSLSKGFVSTAFAGFPYWDQKERKEHLMHCPADSNSNKKIFSNNKKIFSEVTYKSRLKNNSARKLKIESMAAGGGQMLLDESNIIVVDSNITTNQIWTANNIYYIPLGIDVQALLVIEPGTEIRLAYGCTIYINNGGTLISCGRPNNPITYTSAYAYPMHGDYCCAICIEPTASPATKVTYNFIEYAEVGIVTWDISLDTPIENNYFYSNDNGICQQGSHLTDIINNLVFDSYSCGVSIDMEYWDGIPEHEEISDANSHILIQNNTFEWQEDAGIAIFSTKDANNAGLAMLINNIVTDSGYGIYLCDPEEYIVGIVSNTGYGCNGTNKNWDFPEDNPVEVYEYPYVGGAAFYLDQNCPFVDAGLGYIEETPLIGKTTDIDGMPDSNIIDIGFHHPNWQFSNAGTGDYYTGDLDENLIVDFRDFAILANGWRQTYDINDLAQMCGNWLKTGGPEPNIIPVISGDPNSGYVFVGVDIFPANINQIAIFDNGKYLGRLYGFSEDGLIALDVSESGSQDHHLKLICISNTGRITCSNITSVAFSCPLNYCIFPSGYESGILLNFSAINPSEGNVYVELFADGGESVWSHTYSGISILGSIPADITSQHYLDYITLSASSGISPIKKPINPKIKEREIDPATEALIIQPNLWLDLAGCDMLNQVERAFIQNGIKFTRLGWAYATSPLVAAYGWTCPIRYLYVLSHGGYQYDKNGGVLRTRIELVDGVAVSVKRNDFPPYQWPSWCEELELKLEYSPVFSWAAMGFHSLEFAYFNCCYAGRLKINANNQLVIGQQGQIGVFDGPHSDMSYALGMANTNRDCAFQGWYDKAWFALNGASPFSKWTLDEWSELSEGVVGGDLYTAIQYAISRQTSFLDPNAPVNTYRLKGQGLLNAIGLHD